MSGFKYLDAELDEVNVHGCDAYAVDASGNLMFFCRIGPGNGGAPTKYVASGQWQPGSVEAL